MELLLVKINLYRIYMFRVALVGKGQKYFYYVNLQQGDFHWSPDVQGIILSAYFYGYLATEILGAYLAERFGGKIVFGAGLFVSAVFTLVTAPAARWSPYALIAVR